MEGEVGRMEGGGWRMEGGGWRGVTLEITRLRVGETGPYDPFVCGHVTVVKSGSKGLLPVPRPLRTARASYPASGSSLEHR
jgi:hypothetical protein